MTSITSYAPDAYRQEVFNKIRTIPDNQRCFDCKCKNPLWSSVSFGIVLCLECSGKHRSFGPHISFVRSNTLDNWTHRQLSIMELGGNQRAKEFLKKQGKDTFGGYDSPLARKYKSELEERVNKIIPIVKSSEKVVSRNSQPSNQANLEMSPGTQPTAEAPVNPVQSKREQPEIVEVDKTKIPETTASHTKTKFSVKFAPKINKNTQKKKDIASKKIDEELDFNKMFLGDQATVTVSVPEKKSHHFTFDAPETKPKIESTGMNFDTKSSENTRVDENQNKEDKMDKFKTMQGVGSDMLNEKDSNKPKLNVKDYSNCQAMSSDQMFGREESNTPGSRAGEFLKGYEWEDK